MPLTDQQLTYIDETHEVRIETRSDDRSTKTIIWIVVVDDRVYVRSVRGDEGHWYQRAMANPVVAVDVAGDWVEFGVFHVDDQPTIDAVTTALEAKYQPGGSLDRMTRSEVLDNTLRLDPSN